MTYYRVPKTTRITLKDIVNSEKLRQYCEEIYGVPVSAEASDYFARIMIRQIKGFEGYLPLHRKRQLTLEDMYKAASGYF